jgi:hypothetical protein
MMHFVRGLWLGVLMLNAGFCVADIGLGKWVCAAVSGFVCLVGCGVYELTKDKPNGR